MYNILVPRLCFTQNMFYFKTAKKVASGRFLLCSKHAYSLLLPCCALYNGVSGVRCDLEKYVLLRGGGGCDSQPITLTKRPSHNIAPHHLYLTKQPYPTIQIRPVHYLSVTIRAILLLYILYIETLLPFYRTKSGNHWTTRVECISESQLARIRLVLIVADSKTSRS